MTKASIDELLTKTIPWLNVLREVYPKSYQSVLDVFYASYVAGETQVDSIEAARDKLMPILDILKVNADDAVLSDLARWYADAYRALGIKNTVTCYTFASGSSGYGDDLPLEFRSREADLNVRIVKSARKRSPIDNRTETDACAKLNIVA